MCELLNIQTDQSVQEGKKTYLPPAISMEVDLETRAGSPLSPDPLDPTIFGE